MCVYAIWWLVKKVLKVCFKHWTSLTVVCYNDGDRSMGIFLFYCLKIGRSFLYLYFSFSIGKGARHSAASDYYDEQRNVVLH